MIRRSRPQQLVRYDVTRYFGCLIACIGCASTPSPKSTTAVNSESTHVTDAHTQANTQGANTIRVYEPKTGAFFSKPGQLVCSKPSVSGWEQRATSYQQSVRASIHALTQAFTACYIAELRENASARGTSCVRFIVDGEGTITLVEMASATLSEGLQNCVLFNGSHASIPAPSNPPLQVMLPLTFIPKAK